MSFKYNRQDRLFIRNNPVTINDIEVPICIDTSYKENEFESKISDAVNRIENNRESLKKALIKNLYDIHIESWRYDKEKDLSIEDFFSNLKMTKIILTKGDSCTIVFTTGELFDGKLLEVMFEKDGSIFITGLLE